MWSSTPVGGQKSQATLARHVFLTHGGRQRLEGFHTDQKGWLGTLSSHSADAGVALLADGAQRWNRCIPSRQSLAESSSSVYAPGLLKAVETARNLATEVAK